MTTVTIQQAQSTLAELIHRLSLGDEVVITDNDRPVARQVSRAADRKEGRRHIDILNQCVHLGSRADLTRPTNQERRGKRLVIHEALIVPAMLSEIETLIAAIANDGIFRQAGLFEIVENATDILVISLHAAQVVVNVALVLLTLEIVPFQLSGS